MPFGIHSYKQKEFKTISVIPEIHARLLKIRDETGLSVARVVHAILDIAERGGCLIGELQHAESNIEEGDEWTS